MVSKTTCLELKVPLSCPLGLIDQLLCVTEETLFRLGFFFNFGDLGGGELSRSTSPPTEHHSFFTN